MGTAYIHGFKWALERKYQFIFITLNLTISSLPGQAVRISITFLIKTLIVVIAQVAIAEKPALSAGELLSSRDRAIYNKAFKAAQKKDWSNANKTIGFLGYFFMH